MFMPFAIPRVFKQTEAVDQHDADGVSRWQRLFRRNRLSDIDFDALRQFAASIEAEIDLLETDEVEKSGDVESSLIATIRRKLGEISRHQSLELNWSTVYHAEKLMLSLLSDERTGIELQRRINSLAEAQAPFVSFYRGALAEPAATNSSARQQSSTKTKELLLSLATDTQNYNCKRFIKMRYARLAIYKVGTIFFLAFAVFITVLTYGHWAYQNAG